MDYVERAKREEAASLVEVGFQRRLEEEQILHEREQQLEVELSRQHHDGDLREKNRLSRLLDNKERVLNYQRVEVNKHNVEREERIDLIIQALKPERLAKRKYSMLALRKRD